ncbi:MAG TPA: glycosyltransferase family 39 protein [Vicinamibacterales bacterium]|nr:glycosyltransferase family 39 protein [Vicinamibacterales bacterium]
MRPARGARVTLALVLVVAATLRLWGIGFGLPLTAAHPDESRVNYEGIAVAGGDFRPGFFNYPSLFMYTLGAVDVGYCGVRVLRGADTSIAGCTARWRTAWEPFFLAARLVSAAAGTLTVFLVYLLGRRLFDATAGIAAAGFLAVAFLHVRDSHFGVTDVAMTMMVVASVLLLVRAGDRAADPSAGVVPFVLPGVTAGLAASTKYNAVLVSVAALTTVALLWHADPDRQRRSQRALGRAATWLLAMGGGFFAGTPYALLEPVRFWQDVSAEARHLQTGHAVNLGIGWSYHWIVSLRHGVTVPMLAAALAGATWMAWRTPRRAALLLAFPIVYYAIAGRGYTVFARYMIPIVPFLAVCAGFFAASAARWISARTAHAPAAAICAVLVVALGAMSAIKTVQLDRLLTRTDSRVLAADWLMAHAGPRDAIYVSGSHYGRPDVGRRQLTPSYTVVDFVDDEFRGTRGTVFERPQWIVIQESPLRAYSSVPERVQDLLPSYRLTQTFRAVDPDEPHIYDQQDAFFVPLSGFDGVGRPGPNFRIYQRVD